MNILLLKAWLTERGPALIGNRAAAFRSYGPNLIGIELRDEQTAELLICVDVRQPALALAGPGFAPEAQDEPGNFAKALRFHLQNYRLDSIEQAGYDRSVIFTFGRQDTYGQQSVKQLRVELAGSAANAYLLTERGMVVSIMRRRKGELGRVRTVVTGKPLPPPPPLGKFVAGESGADGLEALMAGADHLENKWDLSWLFLNHVAGCDKRVWGRLERLLPVDYSIDTLYEFIARFQQGGFNPELFDIGDGRSANDAALQLLTEAFAAAPAVAHDVVQEDASEALGRQLRHHLELARRADEVEELAAELMVAAGDHELDASVFLHDWCRRNPDWASRVDLQASLEHNSLKLSRFAQRLRRGRGVLENKLADAQGMSATAPDDAAAEGAAPDLKRRATFARLEQRAIKHARYRSTDGLDIVVGANAAANDALLRVLGSGNHLWFHVRDFAGSHVYLLQAGDGAPHTSIRQAAITAAYFSQGRKEDKVDVCYTPVRQIRRPRNARPGMVLVHNETVITVRPALFKELQPQLSRNSA